MRTRIPWHSVVLAAFAFVGVVMLSGCPYLLCTSCPLSVTVDPDDANSRGSASAAAPVTHAIASARKARKKPASARQPKPDTSPTVASTVAPFLGNYSLIPASTNGNVVLQRLADCSLTYGDVSITGSAPGPFDVTVNSEIPSYEKTIHSNAFLATTPDVFPKHCPDTFVGLTSQAMVSLGVGKNGSYLGAANGGNSINTFSATVTPPALSNSTSQTTDITPISLTGGDLNNDGNPDVVSINTDGLNSSISVFLGKADGSYQAAKNTQISGISVTFGVLDDLNNDGKLDLIINAGNNSFLIYLGKGDGTFNAPATFSTGSEMLFGMDKFITADVNNDGKKDIITSEGQVFIGLGNGTSFTFESIAFPRVVTATNGLAPGIVAADFNNDNKLDLATDDGIAIRTYLGNGDGTFSAGPAYAGLPNRGVLIATDLDGDGNMDLLTGFGGNGVFGGDDYLPNQVLALMGNGDGTFQGATSLPIKYSGSNLLDLNGDGRADLVGLRYNGTQYEFDTYLTGANGIPVAGNNLLVPAGVGVDSYVLGAFDTNSNSHADLLYVSAAPQIQSFYLALGAGNGNFSAPTQIPVPTLVPSPGIDINPNISGLHVGDFNHDGKLDIAYSFIDQSNIAPQNYYEGFAVQLGNGDGTFGDPKIVYTYQNPTQPVQAFNNMLAMVADVDQNGAADIFLLLPPQALNQPRVLTLFLGNGDGTFKTPNSLNLVPNYFGLSNDGSYGVPFALADLNGDGKLDIVAAGSDATESIPELAIATGKGDGTFNAATILKTEGFGYAGGPALADFDGDGKIDLYTSGNIEGAGLGIFPGNGDGTFKSISNADGTVSAPDVVGLSTSGAVVVNDLNKDGALDIIVGNVILLNKFSAVQPVLAPTSTIVAAAPNPATAGANVTLTATVTSSTAGTITGTVNFLSDGTQIGSGTVGSGGKATFSSTTIAQGSHSVTAQYGGDGTFAGSTTGTAVTLVINAATKASTSTTVASSLNPSTVGASVKFTATVTSTTAGTITGTVNFFDTDGTTQLGTGTLSGGAASFTTTTLSAGDHAVTAKYLGDANYAASTSPGYFQTVNAAKAATTTGVASSLNPSTVGASVKFTATVTSATAGTITGTVNFLDGATQIGTGTLSGGSASFTTTTLAQASHTITAKYVGDSNYATSTSTAITQVVNAGAKANTTTALSSSVNPSAAGASVMFTATVTSATAGTITGTVNFLDAGAQIGSGTLASGTATFTTSTLTIGSHTITAQYVGDSNYATSTSTGVTQTVNAAPDFNISATPSTISVVAGKSALIALGITPVNGSTQTVSFACSGLPVGAACMFTPGSVTLDGKNTSNSQMTITTTSRGNVAPPAHFVPPAQWLKPIALAATMLLGWFAFAFTRKRSPARRVVFAMLLLAMPLPLLVACGSGNSSGTPKGTTQVTVNVSSGSTTHAVTVALTVN